MGKGEQIVCGGDGLLHSKRPDGYRLRRIGQPRCPPRSLRQRRCRRWRYRLTRASGSAQRRTRYTFRRALRSKRDSVQMRTLLSSQHQDGCVRRKERHRLMRHTDFPVSKSLDDFDFAELVITEGYGRKELLELGLQRVPRASCSMARLGTTSPISPQRSICAYIYVRYEVPFFLSLSQQAPDGSFDGRSPRISAEGHKADGYRDSTRRRRRSPAVPGSLRKLQSALSHSHHQHQAQPMNRGREASCGIRGQNRPSRKTHRAQRAERTHGRCIDARKRR